MGASEASVILASEPIWAAVFAYVIVNAPFGSNDIVVFEPLAVPAAAHAGGGMVNRIHVVRGARDRGWIVKRTPDDFGDFLGDSFQVCTGANQCADMSPLSRESSGEVAAEEACGSGQEFHVISLS